jgi:hypothetical protein
MIFNNFGFNIERTTTDIVTNGLRLYYDASVAGSISSTSVFDLSGNGNTGTLTAASMTSSLNGGTFTFNGTNQIITTPVIPSASPSSSYTIQQAFRTGDTYDIWNRGIFTAFTSPNGLYIGTRRVNVAGQPGMHMYTNGNILTSIGTTGSFVINTWYILTAVATNTSVTIYLNGNTTPLATSATGATGSISTLKIGQTGFDANWWFGQIANTLYYNVALTPTEIVQNYDALKGRFGLT